MPLRSGNNTVPALDFWSDVAQTFGSNDHVMYNLWRIPSSDITTYLDGTEQYVSMPEMVTTIRKYSQDSIIIIQGLN
jgi:hypothetical protein